MNRVLITRGGRAILLRVPLLACCLGLSGCGALALPARSNSAARTAHGEVDLSAFEQKRDEAQYIAARDRAEQGDVDAAETLLKSILERTPNHVEAQLLLADLYVAQERTADAERRLRAVLHQRPDLARAQHSLGLLCDVTGRPEEAAEHFRRAAKAAPQEESYRLSLEASVGGQGDSAGHIARQ